MTSYTDVFGAGQIQPTWVSYKSYTATASFETVWPMEAPPDNNVVAIINDVSATATGIVITMPPANQVSVGVNPLWNNVGANSFDIVTATGGAILTATAGGAYFTYLRDNSTEGGLWRTFQLGAGTAAASAAALAGYGLIAIANTLNQEYDARSTSTSPIVIAASDRASLIVWTGGAGVVTLGSAVTAGNGFFFNIRNAGTGAIVLTPSGAQTIDDATSKTLNPGDACIVVSDGAEWWTVGFGQDAVFAFDYTSIDVSGSGNYTLSGTELNRISYRFTGTLTGDRYIVVPSTVQQYWGDNSTTGSYILGIKTVTQANPGVEIVQGARMITYCNGTDVVNADTQGLATPVPISAGGTGATTASGARSNLNVYSTEETAKLIIAIG